MSSYPPPPFTKEGAAALAADVALLMPEGVEVVAELFDFGHKVGVGVKLANGKRHAIQVLEPVEPRLIASVLSNWIAEAA